VSGAGRRLALFLIALAAAGLAVATQARPVVRGLHCSLALDRSQDCFLPSSGRARTSPRGRSPRLPSRAKANVAWAITSRDGLVVHSEAYRRSPALANVKRRHPPELALPGESAASVSVPLSRKARAGHAHEGNIARLLRDSTSRCRASLV